MTAVTDATADPTMNQPAAPTATSGGPPRRVPLRGVAFDALTERQTIDAVLAGLRERRGGWIVTSNLDHLRRATRDGAFAHLLTEADLVVADGAPLVWAAKVKGDPLPERVAGSTLTWSLTEALAGAGRSLFLLGGNPGVAELAAEKFRERLADVQIVGTYCPPLGFERDPEQLAAIRRALLAARPDVVYVALGSPKQERLIHNLRACLPLAWWMGVGISLSFVAGDVARAPRWLQRLGFEWVHRLMQEPGRLAKRYLVHGIPFALSLLSWAAARRVLGR